MADGARVATTWLAAVGDEAEPGRSRLRPLLVALALALVGLALARWADRASGWIIASLALSFGAAGLALLGRPRRPIGRGLHVDSRGIGLASPAAARGLELIVPFDRPFGLTVLGNRARDRLVVAISSGARTLYVGASVPAAQRRPHAATLAQACTIPDDEPALDAIGPDGEPLDTSLRDLERLLQVLGKRDPRACSRCFLSDTHGLEVALDADELRVGDKRFDLAAPLEWRAFLFQESVGTWTSGATDADARTSGIGGAVMVYQATWIRQGSHETVLVALLASLAGSSHPAAPKSEIPEVERALLRDLRLMQAAPESPPPSDLRVGIERAYMVPLRAALDRAPRASRTRVSTDAAAR